MALLLSLAYQSNLLVFLAAYRDAPVAESFEDILALGMTVNMMRGTAMAR